MPDITNANKIIGTSPHLTIFQQYTTDISYLHNWQGEGSIWAVEYCIYSPISRFAYKSVGILRVILEVFEIDPPISRYHFS
jgi:hypothetical protein